MATTAVVAQGAGDSGSVPRDAEREGGWVSTGWDGKPADTFTGDGPGARLNFLKPLS